MRVQHAPADGVDEELDVRVSSPAEVELEEHALLALAIHADCLNADRGVSEIQLPEAELVHERRLHILEDRFADLLDHGDAVRTHSAAPHIKAHARPTNLTYQLLVATTGMAQGHGAGCQQPQARLLGAMPGCT